jgi:8-oxo-dGTP pyrophosphatase MutT (NUDIX family)
MRQEAAVREALEEAGVHIKLTGVLSIEYTADPEGNVRCEVAPPFSLLCAHVGVTVFRESRFRDAAPNLQNAHDFPRGASGRSRLLPQDPA